MTRTHTRPHLDRHRSRRFATAVVALNLLIAGASAPAIAQARDGDNISSNLEKLFDDDPTRSLADAARAAGYRTHGEAVLLDIVLNSYHDGLKAAIENAGGEVRAISGKYLRASVAVTDAAAIKAIAALPAVEYIYPEYGFITYAGSVTSRAVETVKDIVAAPYNLDGSGVTIGILSDSFARTNEVRGGNTDLEACAFGTLTGTQPQASGDLPAEIEILADDADGDDCPDAASNGDEGAAMAELIHDIAPGADIAFHTVGDSQVEFAAAIDTLCRPAFLGGGGADIVVDDGTFLTELMYQPGPIARSAAACVASGIPYFAAAGNNADNALHREYVDVAPADNGNDYHDWDRNGADDGEDNEPYLQIDVPAQAGFTAVLQWNQPALSAGSQGPRIDLNLLAFEDDGTGTPIPMTETTSSMQDQQASDPSAGADPIEIVTIANGSGASKTYYLAIDHWAGSRGDIPQQPGVPLEFRLVFFEQDESDVAIEHIDSLHGAPRTPASTMYGHSQAPGVISVAAVPWYVAPPFLVTADSIEPEPFTALGGAPAIQFAAGTGAYQPTPSDGPDFAAVDGNNTTFFGQLNEVNDPAVGEPDGFRNFFGTSAAAANAVATAALLLEYSDGLTPAALEGVLEDTAHDVTEGRGEAGDDEVTGAGLISPEGALKEFPTADAGGNGSLGGDVIGAAPGTVVTLDGSGSTDNHDIVSYTWSQAGGENVALNDLDSARPSFTAPATPTYPDAQTFKLSVADADGLTHADEVHVLVKNPPVADAGPDQGANAGETVTLQGSGSDGTGSAGSAPLDFQWIQTAGDTVTLDDAAAEDPSFTVPDPTVGGVLRFQLTITGPLGMAGSDTVSVTVNGKPTANAGPDRQVVVGETVNLSGSGSADPGGTITAYQWTQQAGTSVTLNGATTASPSFTAPSSTATLTFELTVTDKDGLTDTDTVTITTTADSSSGGNGGGGGGGIGWPFLVIAGLSWGIPAVFRRRRRK